MVASVQSESDPRVLTRRVHYTGSDTLYKGYALCYDADAGTAALNDITRGADVEKPATGNLHNFAGIVAETPATGVTEVDIFVPNGGLCQGYTTESCTIGTTLLTVVPDSYLLGGIGEGLVIGRAAQTMDRSSTNGLVLMQLDGPSSLSKFRLAKMNAASHAGGSMQIWETCPVELINSDPAFGIHFFDDFHVPFVMADAVAQAGYYTKQDTGVTIQTHEGSDELCGVLEIANNDDDVDFGHLFLSDGATMELMQIAATSHKPFWFEARLKVEVLTSEIGIFVGLCEIGNVDDAGMVINTAEMKDENFLGFQTLCADPDALLPVFKADGQTKANGTSCAIVADTYFNVGFHGNGTIITGYVNNVSKHAITAALIAGATFPSATSMSLALMTQTGEASESAVSMDWWRFAQLR